MDAHTGDNGALVSLTYANNTDDPFGQIIFCDGVAVGSVNRVVPHVLFGPDGSQVPKAKKKEEGIPLAHAFDYWTAFAKEDTCCPVAQKIANPGIFLVPIPRHAGDVIRFRGNRRETEVV